MINFDKLDELGVNYGIRPENLQDEDIDKSIRHIVNMINESYWVKTANCCGGHLDIENTRCSMPYMVFITKELHLNTFLQLLNDCCKCEVYNEEENRRYIINNDYDIGVRIYGDYAEIALWFDHVYGSRRKFLSSEIVKEWFFSNKQYSALKKNNITEEEWCKEERAALERIANQIKKLGEE